MQPCEQCDKYKEEIQAKDKELKELKEEIQSLKHDAKQRKDGISLGQKLAKQVKPKIDVLHALVEHGMKISNYKCGKEGCKNCQYMKPTDEFEDHSGEKHKVQHPITCKTSNLVYLIQCKKCNKKYVGESGNPLHIAMNDHRSKKTRPVAAHFCQDDHSMEDLEVIGIETGFEDTEARQAKKSEWISTLETIEHGLNTQH